MGAVLECSPLPSRLPHPTSFILVLEPLASEQRNPWLHHGACPQPLFRGPGINTKKKDERNEDRFVVPRLKQEKEGVFLRERICQAVNIF